MLVAFGFFYIIGAEVLQVESYLLSIIMSAIFDQFPQN